MTDSDSTGSSDGGAASTSESKPNWRRDLENRLKDAEDRASAAEERLSGYERRDTFRTAGLDLDDARVKYFVKGYEGELDAEAIRQEAMAAGFLGDDAPLPEINDSMQAEQRIQAVGEGGDPVSPTDLEARIKATTNQDELRALMESQGIEWGASA
tara:strand:- start:1102 stop:1569 length:468 start_codon:yes stop_codon:yes gene_type:complete